MRNDLLIISLFLSATLCTFMATVNADSEACQERLENNPITTDGTDNSHPVKPEKTEAREIEQSPMVNNLEDQLIAEIEKGKGTLLMVVMKEGYIYPAALQMDGLLESYPLKTKVMDYYTSSLLIVTLKRLILFKDIVNEHYQMEFFDDSKWLPLTHFRWDDEENSFLGQFNSAPTWEKYPFSKIRFILRTDKN